MPGVIVLNGAHVAADVPPGSGGGGLPPNPDETLDYLPGRSQSISFQGTLLDYLPVRATCKSPEIHMTWSVDGPPLLGLIDPGGTQHGSYEFTAYYDRLIATEMIDPASAVAQGSTLTEEDYWQLQFAVAVHANTPFTTDLAIASGITDTDTTTFTYTIGIGSADKALLTASLSESFQHAVAISEQETTTYHFQWPQQPYDQVVGIYQLMQSFSVQPGPNLTVWLSQQNTLFEGAWGPWGIHAKFESGATFVYPVPTFYQAATRPRRVPPIGPNINGDEIRQLVQRSNSFSRPKLAHPDPGNKV